MLVTGSSIIKSLLARPCVPVPYCHIVEFLDRVLILRLFVQIGQFRGLRRFAGSPDARVVNLQSIVERGRRVRGLALRIKPTPPYAERDDDQRRRDDTGQTLV